MTAHDAIPARQGAIDALLAHLFPPAPVEDRPAPTPGTAPPDDAELLERAFRSRHGARIAALWRGELAGYPSESEADAALCSYLAFWTGPDPARLDALFRRSGRMRTKWERASYREPTLTLAFKGRTTYYDPREAARVEARFHLDDDEAGDGDDGDGGEPAASGEPSTDPHDHDPSDTGNADLFAARFGDELRHDHRRAVWLRWMGHWWADDLDGHAFRLTRHIARAWAVAAVNEADEKRQRAMRRWALASQALAKREAILKTAARQHPFTRAGDDWDADPDLLGVANGVIDLATGALHDGHPRDGITRQSPAAYDPDAAAPRWEQFLREVFRDDDAMIRFVQRCAGYSLSGDTSEHAVMICWGGGANGKSTLLKALMHVAGSYAYAMPFATFEEQRFGGGGPTNDLAALAGRRLVAASEVNEGQRLNEARVKALAGGDPITARFLNREFFTFRPVATFWLAVNHKPAVADTSRGFWRRIKLIPFGANFEGREEKHLDAALREEAPGILAWLVRGCLAWRREGLAPPDEVLAATEEYRRESDPLAGFLAACCVEGGAHLGRAETLYKAYDRWADEQGLHERERLSSTAFGRRLAERFPKKRDRSGVAYEGVNLSLAWQERDEARFRGPRRE